MKIHYRDIRNKCDKSLPVAKTVFWMEENS